jgi:hypothetical protein
MNQHYSKNLPPGELERRFKISHLFNTIGSVEQHNQLHQQQKSINEEMD